MILEDHDLRVWDASAAVVMPLSFSCRAQNLTPAIRACLVGADNQLTQFGRIHEDALCAAVDASVESLKQQLVTAHRQINRALRAKAQLQTSLDKDPVKFFGFKFTHSLIRAWLGVEVSNQICFETIVV